MRSSCQTAWPPVQRCFSTYHEPVNLSDPQTHRYEERRRFPHRLAHFLYILKPDLADTLTVQSRGTAATPLQYPTHIATLRASLSQPQTTREEKERVYSATSHRQSNFLLNLKSAVAVVRRKGYIHAFGAPTPNLEE